MEWVLDTERLLLREITEEDFDFIIELEARTESYKYEMGGSLKRIKLLKAVKITLKQLRSFLKKEQ